MIVTPPAGVEATARYGILLLPDGLTVRHAARLQTKRSSHALAPLDDLPFGLPVNGRCTSSSGSSHVKHSYPPET
jgi:hypothetical protein